MSEADPQFGADSGEPPATQASAERRRWPWPVKLLIGIVAAIVLAWLILYITKGRFLRQTFERTATKMLKREVKVAGDFQLYLDWFNVKLVADRLSIANPAWRGGQFFVSNHIDTRIRTWPLLFGERKLMWLNLADGRLDLAWDKAHRRNTFTFGDPSKPAEPFEMPDIERAAITGTRIAYLDPLMQLNTDIRVDTVQARDTRVAGDIRFSGDGSIRGKPFTLTGRLLSPNETASGGSNRLVLTARGAGATVLDVSGTLPGATVIEGADLTMRVRGRNMADLFDFLGVAVPETRAYRFASHLTKDSGAWRFTRLGGRFGDSDLAGAMTITLPNDRLNIAADLSTRVLDIIDVAPFIGYNPDRIDKAGDRGVIQTVGGTPRVLPDAPLRIEAIKRFDAQVRYRVARVRAKSFPISNIGLTLDLDNSLLKLAPLTFDVAGGKLWSDISINARAPAVVTTYDVKLSPTPMGRLLGRFGVEESGTTGTISARVKMTGTGDSVRRSLATSNGRMAFVIPQGKFWTRNVQLAELDVGTFFTKLLSKKLKKPVDINCGLVAFTVRNGIAATDPILIDTDRNVIIGRGGFSFRNEAMDMAFRADGKTFSLFSAQSPIGINGYFARPGFAVVSPELLGRAGAGLGLSIVGTPLAGVLAFVDVGDAKSAACGPVLAGATAKAQRTTKGETRDDVGRGTTAKSEDGKRSKSERQDQRKKFLGIF